MNKLRKGDQVVVLTGRDRGRRGAVLRVKDGRPKMQDMPREMGGSGVVLAE